MLPEKKKRKERKKEKKNSVCVLGLLASDQKGVSKVAINQDQAPPKYHGVTSTRQHPSRPLQCRTSVKHPSHHPFNLIKASIHPSIHPSNPTPTVLPLAPPSYPTLHIHHGPWGMLNAMALVCTPSVPKYSVLECSNFVPKYKVLEGYDKIEWGWWVVGELVGSVKWGV
jgi:hypothetical protein